MSSNCSIPLPSVFQNLSVYIDVQIARSENKVADNETNGSRFNSFAVQAIIRKKWTVVDRHVRGLDKAKSQASVNLISLSFIVFNIIHE